MADSTAILVLGMHRSGTSATAGWLHALGVNLGPYLMAEDPTQPKGYFEHAEIVGIHNDLMTAFDSSWDDPRPLPEGWEHDHRVRFFREQLMEIVRRDLMTQPLWGAKDPSIIRLGPGSFERALQLLGQRLGRFDTNAGMPNPLASGDESNSRYEDFQSLYVSIQGFSPSAFRGGGARPIRD